MLIVAQTGPETGPRPGPKPGPGRTYSRAFATNRNGRDEETDWLGVHWPGRSACLSTTAALAIDMAPSELTPPRTQRRAMLKSYAPSEVLQVPVPFPPCCVKIHGLPRAPAPRVLARARAEARGRGLPRFSFDTHSTHSTALYRRRCVSSF